MKFNDKEERLLKVLLHKPEMNQQGSSENELNTAAKMLFGSLKERGVTAENLITGANGQAQTDQFRLYQLELEIQRLQSEKVGLRSTAMRWQREAEDANVKLNEAYSKGFEAGRRDANWEHERTDFKRSERSERTERTERKSTAKGRNYDFTDEQKAQAQAHKAEWERAARDYEGDSADFVMEFGKWRGNRLENISLNWLNWAVDNIKDMPNTIEIIADYLNEIRRNRRS